MSIKHGMSNTKIYNLYHHIKDRCYNQNHHQWHNYGGRGIKMCDEWLGENGFMHFYDWAIHNGYEYGLTIDRIDNDGDYCPDNCMWITRSENVSKANKSKRTQHRKANKGCYWGLSPSGSLYLFINANKFADDHHLKACCIRSAANKKIKTHANWKFGFVKDIIDDFELQ